MKLGIYGGTFDPIHNGHVKVAKDFLVSYSLDKLLIIPAGIPPHKQVSWNDDPEKRLEMCRLAFKSNDKIEVSDTEIRRQGKSYTVLTLRELKKSEDELFFLCGTDMLLSFDKWFRFEEILELCTLVCVRRYNYNEPLFINKIKELRTNYGAGIEILKTTITEMSSSDIRERIRHGENVAAMIPQPVYEYINLNNLYKNERYDNRK